MISSERIAVVINAQQKVFLNKPYEIARESINEIRVEESQITVITGIRGCGKNTVVLQYLMPRYAELLYLTFEDIRLIDFEEKHFPILKEEIDLLGMRVLVFDEIQQIEGWESFVTILLSDGYSVFVISSNKFVFDLAFNPWKDKNSPLTLELFPLSYREFITYGDVTTNEGVFLNYLQAGGMPEYLKTADPLIFNRLLEDVLIKDIGIHQSVRDMKALKQLAVYLLSNVGDQVSANQLAGSFGIQSSSTIQDCFDSFQDAYLVEFVPKFGAFVKAQPIDLMKIYAVDNGFVEAVSTSFTDDLGRKLENLIYLHLRRSYKEIYYFVEKEECDFVVFENGKIVSAVQVCYNIDDSNEEQEYNGLLEAMRYFKIQQGTIVTMNQERLIEKDGVIIKMVPAHLYLMASSL